MKPFRPLLPSLLVLTVFVACSPSSEEPASVAGSEVEDRSNVDAVPPEPLVGSSWRVLGYDDGQAALVSVNPSTSLGMRFGQDGSVSGSAGCNNYNGGFELDGQAIRFGPMAMTRKMCAGEGVMEQESAFLVALATVAGWEIRGDRLELRRADGALAVDLGLAEAETAD